MHNQADTLVYATEKSLKDFGDKVNAAEKEQIEKKIAELKEAIKSKDSAKIKQGMEELSKASHKLAEEVYKAAAAKQGAGAQAQPGAGAAGAAGAGPQPQQEPKQEKKEDVIDAEYTTEDDTKKT